jgi:hypothetical protein
MDKPPWATPHEHGDHPCCKGGTDVVVEPIAHVGDLTRRASAFGNDPGKELRGWLLDLPSRRGSDEVDRQVQSAKPALRLRGLVARGPDQEAELLPTSMTCRHG